MEFPLRPPFGHRIGVLMYADLRILEALLGGVPRPAGGAVLDISRRGSGANLLEKEGIRCDRAPRLRGLYRLVICEEHSLQRIRQFLQPTGTALVHASDADSTALTAANSEFKQTALARTRRGAWIRLEHVPNERLFRPRVSLVAVVRDDAEAMSALLRRLSDEPTDPAWELVIVDLGSLAHDRAALEGLPGQARVAQRPPGTTSRQALWEGVTVARGDVIVPVDLDAPPAYGFACALSSYLDGLDSAPEQLLRGVSLASTTVASRSRGPVAVPWAIVPETAAELERMLDASSALRVPGFRTRPMRTPRTASPRPAPQELHRRPQTKPHPVLAKSG